MGTSELLLSSTRPSETAGQRFRTARRGCDPDEVREYLILMAEEVGRLEQELQWQRARNELLERQCDAAREAAYARISRHLTDVVRSADAAAAQLRSEADHDARATMTAALEKARRITAAAQQEAEYIRSLAREEALQIRRAQALAQTNGTAGPRLELAGDPDRVSIDLTGLQELDVAFDLPDLDVVGSAQAEAEAEPGAEAEAS